MMIFHNLALEVYSSYENHRSEGLNTAAMESTQTFRREVRRPGNRVCAFHGQCEHALSAALDCSQYLFLVRNSQFAALHGT